MLISIRVPGWGKDHLQWGSSGKGCKKFSVELAQQLLQTEPFWCVFSWRCTGGHWGFSSCIHIDLWSVCFGILQEGLKAVSDGISKLVNLRVLTLTNNTSVTHIPEAISCLQKLEHLEVLKCPVNNMPANLNMLTNLTSLQYRSTAYGAPEFFPSLQVNPPMKQYWNCLILIKQ
jgi:hypothetical protein